MGSERVLVGDWSPFAQRGQFDYIWSSGYGGLDDDFGVGLSRVLDEESSSWQSAYCFDRVLKRWRGLFPKMS